MAGTFNPSLFFRFTVYFLSACVSCLLVFPICLCIPSPYVSHLLMYPVCLCILSPYVSCLLVFSICLFIYLSHLIFSFFLFSVFQSFLSAYNSHLSMVPVYLCFYFLFFYFLFFPERQKYLQKVKNKEAKTSPKKETKLPARQSKYISQDIPKVKVEKCFRGSSL